MPITPKPGLFITATGTAAGKTLVTRALVAALRDAGQPVLALKPAETGCDHEASDALALARACGMPELAEGAGFYRVRPALAPAAAALQLGQAPPTAVGLAEACRRYARPHTLLLVEGAGGLLVPLNPIETMADLAGRLGFPLLLIAPDTLGTLSHTLTAYESAMRRGLTIAAVVLNNLARANEPAARSASNQALLAARLPVPVLGFPQLAHDDEASLIQAVHASQLLPVLGFSPRYTP